jgi:hypothetical protein
VTQAAYLPVGILQEKKLFSRVLVFSVSISWICCQLFRASQHGHPFQKAERLEEENGPFFN